MRKQIRKIFMLVSVSLCIILSLGFPVFANQNKIWVPIDGTAHSPDGEPVLTILQSSSEKLNLEMQTSGFFSSDQQENLQTYKVLQIGKYNGDLSPGCPNLPVLRRYIYIPAGKTAYIEVIPGSPVTLNDYLIYPVQKPRPVIENTGKAGFIKNDSIYRSDSLFPSRMVFIEKSIIVRGHHIALLHICPFQYNPAQKVLEVFPRMEVQVTFSGQSKQIDRHLYSPVFDRFVKGFVLNPGVISGDSLSQEESTGGGAEFLIITAPDFLTPANDLHDHKETIGISTIVKTTAETGTTSSQIKSYIQNAYDTWSPAPSYVLLLGDVEFIPTNYETNHPWHDADTGTDLYYSTVDGNDYDPDIFLGRIPVDTLSQAATVIQKIIDYESTPPGSTSFYANAAAAAYYQDDYEPYNYEDGRFVKTSEEIRDYLLTKGYDIERIYYTDQYVTPLFYNNDVFANGEPLPTELLKSNGFPWDGDAADINSAVNSGVFLLMHIGHGMDRNCETYSYSHTGWGDPYYVETHVDALTNGDRLPVVFSMNCMTGWFDGETDHNASKNYESFCELFLRKANGGAVGLMGATRVSYTYFTDFLVEGFVDYIWPNFLPSVPNNSGASSRLGPMLNHGKIAMDIICQYPEPWVRKVMYETWHVIGDPTMHVWTHEPVPSITVTSPNGGEKWEQGNFKYITWIPTDLLDNVEIRLVYKANGEEYMIEENTENDGIYEWEVGMCTHISTSQLSIPQGMIHPGNYKVKILSVNDPGINDSSNDYFSIVEPSSTPSITVTSPNGGESCPPGFTYNITWNAQGLSNNVEITLWKNGSLLGIIADNLDPSASPYAWTVGQYNGGTAPTGAGYTIKIKEMSTTVADTSDASFSIVEPSITVTSPNGGESWQIGSTQNITWNSQGITGNLTISLWQNGSRLGTIKDNIDPGDGTYAWIVGQYDGVTAPEGTGYEIIIRDSVTSIYDFCDAPFTLTIPDEVTYTLYPTTVPNAADWIQESNIIGEYDGNKAEGTPTGTTYLIVTNFDNWTLPAGKVITKVEYGILARFTDGVTGKARMQEITHGETARWITFGTNWDWRDFDITSLEVSWTKAEVDALQVAVRRAYTDDPATANLRVGGIRLKVTVE